LSNTIEQACIVKCEELVPWCVGDPGGALVRSKCFNMALFVTSCSVTSCLRTRSCGLTLKLRPIPLAVGPQAMWPVTRSRGRHEPAEKSAGVELATSELVWLAASSAGGDGYRVSRPVTLRSTGQHRGAGVCRVVSCACAAAVRRFLVIVHLVMSVRNSRVLGFSFCHRCR